MSALDWAVLVVYLVAIIAFGLWSGRGNVKIDDFFLAGRQMRWWAVGLSVMATQISAITFIGTTGQAYNDGMRFLVVYFGLPFAMVILCLTLVPFFYRAGVFTAYEYLEKRFDSRTQFECSPGGLEAVRFPDEERVTEQVAQARQRVADRRLAETEPL